jgi:hypothetical protein
MRTTIDIDGKTFIVDLCLTLSNARSCYKAEPEWRYADVASFSDPPATQFPHSTGDKNLSEALLTILSNTQSELAAEAFLKEEAERQALALKNKTKKKK